MSNRTLSWYEFQQHMLEAEVLVNSYSVASVAIRSGEGIDFGLAAVHREGDVLIFDMGHALEEIP